MACAAGPKTVTDGLIFALDARNAKTYDEIPGITDHGISDWYCFISGTATYSAIYPDTEIIEIDANGNEVGIVTTGSDPQRGTFSTTAGRRYYGTKAVHLLQTTVTEDQHELAPVSFAGTYFAHRWIRNSPTTYYAYAPQDDTTLEFFDNNAAGGVTGSVTSTHTISRGFTTSFQSTAINTWQFFKADKPIIMTAGGTGVDKTILAPATQYNYKRRNNYNITINNTIPSTSSTYVTYDTSLPVATVEIGDGAGGDCTQGIGYEYLSDTYSWGDVLSDYQIVAPYADTTVTVSYWNTGTSSWVVGETHSLSGTQTSPDAVDRDGTNGFGVDGTTTSGLAANLASGANLWKFEGTQPFALIINDNSDDEERLLGWMSNKYLRTSSNVTQSFVNLIDKEDRSRMKLYGKDLTTTSEYAGAKLSASDYFEFDGVDDYVSSSSGISSPISFGEGKSFTIEIVFETNDYSSNQSIIARRNADDSGSTDYMLFYSADDIVFGTGSASDAGAWMNLQDAFNFNNQIMHFCGVVSSTGAETGTKIAYKDGVQINSRSYTTKASPTANPTFIGKYNGDGYYLDGKIYSVKIYNRALTASEVKQNYNATKSRFGL
jgi:hypothetical protein